MKDLTIFNRSAKLMSRESPGNSDPGAARTPRAPGFFLAGGGRDAAPGGERTPGQQLDLGGLREPEYYTIL